MLFNFETTAEGAEWIDEVAAETKRVLDGFHGEVVVGHTDWSVDQMRFEGGEAVSCKGGPSRSHGREKPR